MKGDFKVCVYAICKNESKFVDRWVDSMSEADLIVALDTGSADDTVARLRSRGVLVFERRVEPWRFDTARNLSLSFVPVNCQICVCTDLDEVFEKGWRRLVEKAWNKNPGPKQLFYTFHYYLYPDGTPGITNNRHTKIHSRQGFRWVSPLHEFIQCESECEQIVVSGLVLRHLRDEGKDRSDYKRLHRIGYQEGQHWLGEPPE